MNVIAKLRESAFSATEKRVAEYILKHREVLGDVTISEVAKACGTSKSMVVQLCKTIGFKGYKDLRGQLQVEQALSEREQRDEDGYDDIYPGCTMEQICQITVREELRSIQNTADLLDLERLDEAIELILGAEVTQLFGVGGSAVAALDMYNKLRRVGLNARFVQDTHCQMLETTSLNARSVALVFSYNGSTKDMIEACELCREVGAKIISITHFGKNPISELSDVSLFVASNESLRRVTAMSSRLSTLALVDLLFACLASRVSDRIQPIVKRNTEIAAARRMRANKE